MLQPNFKSVIEDSYRNKYYFYYSGTSICCKQVSRDGITRDTIIVSQVSNSFLATVDLQDRIFVACHSKEKGLYIFQYHNGNWKLEQILNIQSSGNIILLSLFALNGVLHIIYAKQMAVANFYNICHLYKPSDQDSYHVNSSWKKYNICEMYAEDPQSSYAAIISKEGIIHMVCEWFDGTNYLINYNTFTNPDDAWNKKTITSLFKKDIRLTLLYDENLMHLLCYTYEDDASAIFYYIKKEGLNKDFEFFCLDSISTDSRVSPFFHIESSVIYGSWIEGKKFYQYSLGKEQKNWVKKINSVVPDEESIQLIEYIRNRKGRHWVIKNTYFTIDYKYNINLPYFKENVTEETNSAGANSEKVQIRNADGDLVRYIPYLMEEVHTLSQMVMSINEKLSQFEGKKPVINDAKTPNDTNIADKVPQKEYKEVVKLKRSNFKDQFLKSNSLLSRPEATAIFMGTGAIPTPDEISKKEAIPIVENQLAEPPASQPKPDNEPIAEEPTALRPEVDPSFGKDGNIFKKIGDFFK